MARGGIRELLGWIVLFCTPFPLLWKLDDLVFWMAESGIDSALGSYGDFVVTTTQDAIALGLTVIALLLSRYLLGEWKKGMLLFLLGITVVILVQDYRVFNLTNNYIECRQLICP